jgi:hypothetical protein
MVAGCTSIKSFTVLRFAVFGLQPGRFISPIINIHPKSGNKNCNRLKTAEELGNGMIENINN